MKNALLAILIICCFSSCYRDRPLPDKRSMLAKHKWYMKAKAHNWEFINPECAVQQEWTFNKDCTGTFANIACDKTMPNVTTFDWYLSSDSHLIHIRKLGEKTDFALLRIESIYDDELTLLGYYNGGGRLYVVLKDVKQEP